MCGLLHSLNQHAGAIQAGTSVVVAGLTVWLITTTRKYVKLTDSALNLSRQQFTEAMRVETFLNLRTPPKTSTAYEAFLELANLSGRGIWWTSYRVTVTSEGRTGLPVEEPVACVVSAYGVHRVPCPESFYRAYRATGGTHEKPVVRIHVEATFRASGESHSTALEIPELILLGGRFVFLDGPEP